MSQLFFELEESAGYVVAGGAALLASDLITRPTQDLDLFAGAPIVSVIAAKDALIAALHERGWKATLVHDDPMFCRLLVTGEDEVLVDLALDSPPASTPELTILGPTLAPLACRTVWQGGPLGRGIGCGSGFRPGRLGPDDGLTRSVR